MEINQTNNVNQLINAWRNPEHKFNQFILSDAKVKNKPIHSTISLTPYHPDFEKIIERNISLLVKLLVYKFNLIVYSSCEGHMNENYYNEREVRVLFIDDDEFNQEEVNFTKIFQKFNNMSRSHIYLKLEKGLLNDPVTAQDFNTLIIKFSKPPTMLVADYFSSIGNLYNKFLDFLLVASKEKTILNHATYFKL